MKIGYARVSTAGQDLDVQLAALRELGVEGDRVYTDHGFTGKSMSRDGLKQALAAVREGDTLIVPRLDRLARNVEDALKIIRDVTDRGVLFQNGRTVYDPSDPMAKMVMTILAAVAEAEGSWISLRTKEALAKPSVRAKMRGRQPARTPAEDAFIADLVDAGTRSIAEIAALQKTSRGSIYRAVERHRARVDLNEKGKELR